MNLALALVGTCPLLPVVGVIATPPLALETPTFCLLALVVAPSSCCPSLLLSSCNTWTSLSRYRHPHPFTRWVFDNIDDDNDDDQGHSLHFPSQIHRYPLIVTLAWTEPGLVQLLLNRSSLPPGSTTEVILIREIPIPLSLVFILVSHLPIVVSVPPTYLSTSTL